jgi:hypothetical protein
VIGLAGGVRVMVATRPVDFRKGAEGLAALVREEMKSDPFSGAVYVFRAKRADRVKAECTKRRHSPLSRAALGLVGRTGLETGSRSARDAGADAAGMIAAE